MNYGQYFFDGGDKTEELESMHNIFLGRPVRVGTNSLINAQND